MQKKSARLLTLIVIFYAPHFAQANITLAREIAHELQELAQQKAADDLQTVVNQFNRGRNPAAVINENVGYPASSAFPEKEGPPPGVALQLPEKIRRLPKAIPASASIIAPAPQLGAEQILVAPEKDLAQPKLKKLKTFETAAVEFSVPADAPLIFDIPVTYNDRVKFWIKHYQTSGRSYFKNWLEHSARYVPIMQAELARAGLPQDLVYVAMIESGFSPAASSHMGAIGIWQFIIPTARRYGMRTDWWLDERRDVYKSTRAAIEYMTDLYRMFGSWYLVTASYNMGENGVKRLIKRYGTNNFWQLADMGVLPDETKNYVPKIIAAMLIAKAPALYGFRDLQYQLPQAYEYFHVPGGTDLVHLARFLGVSEKYLKELNPELIRGFVPKDVAGHQIRIPKGSMMTVSQYVRQKLDSSKN